MKKLICSLLFALFLLPSLNLQICKAQWVQTNGPFYGRLYSVAASKGKVFAGINRKAYSSNDAGLSWVPPPSNNDFNGAVVFCLFPIGGSIFAGTDKGIYSSSISQIDWWHTFTGVNDSVESIAIEGYNILASSDTTLYLSTNYGSNWNQIRFDHKLIKSVCISGNYEYVGTSSGLYVSTNNGSNWNISSLTTQTIHSISTNGLYTFAGTDYGVFISSDNGLNWMQTSLNNLDVMAVAIKENILYTGTNNGLFYSNNLGASWTQFGGLNNKVINSLAVNHDTIIAATEDTAYICLNRNYHTAQNSWKNFLHIASLGSIGDKIFAGSIAGGIYTSTNNGSDWIYSGLNKSSVVTILTNGNNVIAGASPYLYNSTNQGITWNISNISKNNIWVRALALNGNKIYAGTGIGIYMSTNNCLTWDQIGFDDPISTILIHKNKVMVGFDDERLLYGIYSTTNDGISWDSNGLNDKDIKSLASSGNYIYAGTAYDGLYISSNDGASWIYNNFSGEYINAISIEGNNIFASVYPIGIYFSSNNGNTWTLKNQGFTSSPFGGALLISNNSIYSTLSQQGVWKRSISEIVGINNLGTEIPSHFLLQQNYPNPFNPITKINFSLPIHGFVSLKVFDALGREVKEIVNENLSAGSYSVDFNGAEFASGIYFYSLKANGFSETKRMVLMK